MTEADVLRRRLSDDLDRIAEGDRAALHRVYDRTSAKLYGICVRIVRDRAVAEDVLQEVYLKIWHRARGYDRDRASPITWLCAIARNSAVDQRRAAGRRHEEPEDAVLLAADASPHAAAAVDPHARLALVECLDQLEEQQHHSIRAAFIDGYTYAELATRAAVPLGTMKSWIRRGLERLRKCLDGD